LYFAEGSPTTALSDRDLHEGLTLAFERLGPRRRVLAVPPDITRLHSKAGLLAGFAARYYGPALADVLPALGTHRPMTPAELDLMYPGVPRDLIRPHRWRKDVVTIGEVPAAAVARITGGSCTTPWPAQLNRLVHHGGHDLILSIGQVVPHEVVGMANGNKNLFVGTGGARGINASHFIGAVHGMERMMGRPDTPLRRILNSAEDEFCRHLPVVYVQTVIGAGESGEFPVRGLFVGDREAFERAAALSAKVNVTPLDEDIPKAVVYLDPSEFRSTWLANKGIYRTRMAIADDGELILVAPGVDRFGEDPEIDALIRKYGYRGTARVLQSVREDAGLRNNLSAAAHLIHGSSEGRFRITYSPGRLSRKAVEDVGYQYAAPAAVNARYDLSSLCDGWNTLPGGERVFFIRNPALGLWTARRKFR